MAPFLKRRREAPARTERVRLDEERDERPPPEAVKRAVVTGLLLVAALLVILELLFPAATPGTGAAMEEGQVAREEIVAPFDFDVVKTETELADEREWEAAQVLPVFEYDAREQTERRKRFGEFLTRVYGVRGGSESDHQKLDMLGQLGVALSDTTRLVLLDPQRSRRVEELAREMLLAVSERGVLSSRGARDLSADDSVMLVRGNDESMEFAGRFVREEEVPATVRAEAERLLGEKASANAVVEIVQPFVTANVLYGEAETERRKEAARQSVSEKTEVDIKEDEVIIEKGERITRDHVRIIRSMDLKARELLRLEAGPARFFPQSGRILQAMALLGAFALYLSVRRPGMLYDMRCQLLFLLLVAVVMAAAAAVGGLVDAARYLVPVALLAMLTSMLFDLEFAMVSTFFVVVLTAVYAKFGLPFVLISIMGGAVAAHSVRRVRHREDFYWSGIRVVAAYAVVIALTDLARADVSSATLTRMGWGGVNAIVSMGIVVVSLPLFERGFRVTTDITLLELADMNKPLLRKMAMTAPGTYHHSIVVGNLSEAAAEAVRANGLLARVGSYYHDIGKLVTPGYFVENQQGIDAPASKHEGIRPKVSSLVIRAHIRDGVELAIKEGLPEPVIDIIREHHGTSVMEYFYSKALEQAEDPSEVSSDDFSYPGPRPRSKESAIISLADTIEARIRSIDEPLGHKRIEAEVDQIIEKRWQGHQLDAAELTLSDLRKIRDAFSRVLVGMYHQRVKYPDQEDDDGSDEGDSDQSRPGESEDGDGR
jgi:putative nucleotidyltransferase with HDIG domain